MNKTLFGKNEKSGKSENQLFDEDTVEEARRIILFLKNETADIRENLRERHKELVESQALLLEIKEIIAELKQPGLFADSENDYDDEWSQLEEMIGSETAQKVAEIFAGSTIYVPKNILISQNYRAIRNEYQNGATYRELGVKYGYTETHIRNIIHRKKPDMREAAV